MILATLKAYQAGTEAPDVVFVENPLGLTIIETARVQQGIYTVKFSQSVLEGGQPGRYYISNNLGDHFSVTVTGGDIIQIQTHDAVGELEDGRLGWAVFDLHNK